MPSVGLRATGMQDLSVNLSSCTFCYSCRAKSSRLALSDMHNGFSFLQITCLNATISIDLSDIFSVLLLSKVMFCAWNRTVEFQIDICIQLFAYDKP